MAGTPIGRILLMPRGNYSATDVYNHLDVVRFSGASWVCKVDNTTNIAPPTPPVTSNANWQLLAEDGTVGGWSSLTGKPFDAVGDGLNVNSTNELEVAVGDGLKINSTTKEVEVDKSTSVASGDTKPVTSGAVYSKLTSDYYTKAEIDSQEQPLVNNAGSKTWNDLITNASTYLQSSNTNKFYRLSTAGEVTTANQSLFVAGIVEGEHFSVDSHIAVVEESAGVYKYDYFGGGIEPEVYFEITDNSLSYTFTHDAITEDSTINLYSNIVGDKYTNISVSVHTCTVTMAVAQARTLTIYVK